MTWYKLSKKIPEEENEGDYFLIHHNHPNNPDDLSSTPLLGKIIDKRIRYIDESPMGYDPLLSKIARDKSIRNVIIWWKKLTPNEMMAYL